MRIQAEAFKRRIERQVELYETILGDVGETQQPIVHLDQKAYHSELISAFGPALPQSQAKVDLGAIYTAAYHPRTKAVVVANKGMTLLAQAAHSKKHFMIRHVAATVYQPTYGVEMVNIGIVGNLYSGPVILRAESACPPAFLFNSQRCNCAYQWASIKELAAHLNTLDLPEFSSSAELERWTETQFTYKEYRHEAAHEGPGVLMFHLDSQAGMGSGWTEGEFCYDLGNRAVLRQLGENTVEQTYHTTIKEGYEALGVFPDARQKGAYQVPRILLDWLGTSQDLICLSNNTHKLTPLKEAGYRCRRIKSLGQVLEAGMLEAKQRNEDFSHLDIGKCLISFEEEMERLKQEIND